MRILRGFLLVLLLAPVVVVAGQAPAMACSCVGLTDRQAFEGADAVFIGDLVEYEAPPSRNGVVASTDPAVWTFAPTQVYKGDVVPKQEVVSEVFGASCGLEIPKQGEFLVFATKATNGRSPRPAAGELYAGLCGGTRRTVEGLLAPEIATPHPLASGLGPSDPTQGSAQPKNQSTSRPSGPWVVGSIAALVAVASVAFAARSRHLAARNHRDGG
jgi:hypothetical protein